MIDPCMSCGGTCQDCGGPLAPRTSASCDACTRHNITCLSEGRAYWLDEARALQARLAVLTTAAALMVNALDYADEAVDLHLTPSLRRGLGRALAALRAALNQEEP